MKLPTKYPIKFNAVLYVVTLLSRKLIIITIYFSFLFVPFDQKILGEIFLKIKILKTKLK